MKKPFLHTASHWILLTILFVNGLGFIMSIEAKSNGQGHKTHSSQGKHWKNATASDNFWRDEQERKRFRDWLYNSNGRYNAYYNVPTSILTRNGITREEFAALPPGIQKNVLRGKPIPPGLQPGHRLNNYELGQVRPIADSILDALGIPVDRYRYSDGRRVGRYGNDAIIYNPISGIIFDALRGVF